METKGKSGFTLIELITVIAMLLLLVGAVTSSVSGARRRAKTPSSPTRTTPVPERNPPLWTMWRRKTPGWRRPRAT